MSKNFINTSSNTSEIGLNEIYNQLFESKKLIIITTILFTILAFIYVSQKDTVHKSSVLIEIGNYVSLNNEFQLVEPASKLVDVLKRDIHYKDVLNIPTGKKINFRSIGDSLVEINYSSSSLDSNKDYLNSILNYTFNRHKNIFNKSNENSIKKLKSQIDEQKYKISRIVATEIENLVTEIDNIKIKIPAINKQIELLKKIITEDEANIRLLLDNLSNYEYEKVVLENQSKLLTNKLTAIQDNSENILSNEELISAELEIKSLEAELKLLNDINFTMTSSVKGISNTEVRPNSVLVTLFGFIVGLTLSISIVYFKSTWGNINLRKN